MADLSELNAEIDYLSDNVKKLDNTIKTYMTALIDAVLIAHNVSEDGQKIIASDLIKETS